MSMLNCVYNLSYYEDIKEMFKKSLLIIVMFVVAFGCANQQKDDSEVVVEEISLAVTGLA